MGVQVTTSANQIDKQRLGYQAMSLTHFSDTAEPSVAAGSKCEVGGALYEFTADEAGTGWGGIGASNDVYIALVPSGASIAWIYTTTAPAWNTAKQGWYSGSNRYIGGLYKDAAGNYALKWLYSPLDTWEMLARGSTRPIRRKVVEIGDWDMTATHYVSIAHGLIISKIRNVCVAIRDDTGNNIQFGVAPVINNSGVLVSGPANLAYYSTVTSIYINRLAGGLFNDAAYNATSYNRGYVYIEYEA